MESVELEDFQVRSKTWADNIAGEGQCKGGTHEERGIGNWRDLRGELLRQMGGGRAALAPMMHLVLIWWELGNLHELLSGTDQLQMQGCKKMNCTAAHKLSCKRLRPDVEDQS